MLCSVVRTLRKIIVKVLSSSEVMNVSGGFDAVAGLCIMSAASLAVGIYNANEINRIKSIMRFDHETLDFVYSWSIYHDAQLSMLPHYSDVSAMNFDQAFTLAY